MTQNTPSFTLNQTISSLSESVKFLKNKFYNVPQTQRKRAYDLATVLADWEIESPLMADVLKHISRTSEGQEKMSDVRDARGYLFLYLLRSRKGIEFDELVGAFGYIRNPESVHEPSLKIGEFLIIKAELSTPSINPFLNTDKNIAIPSRRLKIFYTIA